jgi:outer membrane protein OmpA-like peptidoglycan-associated protein
MVAAALVVFVTGCGSSGSEEGSAATSTTEATTTLATTVSAPISIPSAQDLNLDLPGAKGELDLVTCTLSFPIEAGTLRFHQGSAELPAEGPARDLLNAILDQFATASTVQVLGHASTEGSAEVNDALARDRAAAVASAGRARLPRVTWVDHGMGATSTTIPEDGTEATRSKNRRVELTGTIKLQECAVHG